MYDEGRAAQWLEDHPDFCPLLHEGRADMDVISLVGFISPMAIFYEWQFDRMFPVQKPKKWSL